MALFPGSILLSAVAVLASMVAGMTLLYHSKNLTITDVIVELQFVSMQALPLSFECCTQESTGMKLMPSLIIMH